LQVFRLEQVIYLVDGAGPLPDSKLETLAYTGIFLFAVLLFGFFTGLDSQVNYIVTAPDDYFLSESSSNSIYFSQTQVDLMNSVSERSVGFDAVADERLYCGEVRNKQVASFRFADSIESGSLTSVKGSCFEPVDIFVHSQPGGSNGLSMEDKDLESEVGYTCVQFQEISVSPVSYRLNGLNCWKVVDGGEGFDRVEVFLQDSG
jgi:hypothetical protein